MPRKPAAKRARRLAAPAYLTAALRRNRKAPRPEGFSLSHRNDYVEGITEAKTEETRRRRLRPP